MSRSRMILPPAKSILGHIFRNVVQTFWDISQGSFSNTNDPSSAVATDSPISWNTSMDVGWLLAQGWADRYKGLFHECKVHRIVVHFMPYAPPTEPGEYSFTLSDFDENTSINSFIDAVGAPASVIRKTGQPARLEWFPTEPEDRNWQKLGDRHQWCTATLYAAESVYKTNPDEGIAKQSYQAKGSIAGKIVAEVDMSFRGKPPKPQPAGYDAPFDSPEFRSYSKSIRCTCRRCLRIQLSELRNAVQAQAFMDLEIVG